MSSVRTAVVPTAGFGTRFLPASRSVPKVMLPVLDVPVIHHTVKEASDSGIEHIVFVVSARQGAIGAYFQRIPDLEAALERQGKDDALRLMMEIAGMADVSYVEQPEQRGLGHAVLMARAIVGREPFAVFLPDDVIWSDSPTMGSMVESFERLNASVIAVKEVPDSMVPSLGIVEPRSRNGRVYELAGMVEKPPIDEAPSNLAIIGRYVLTPEVFDLLERTAPGAIGEVQLTDAIAALMPTQRVYGYRFPGFHIDVGTPPGLLKASIYAALQREDLADDVTAWIKSVIPGGEPGLQG